MRGASVHVAPMPANKATIGNAGTQKRSMRCVKNHQPRNTNAKYAASHHAMRRRGPTSASAANGISSGLSQGLVRVTSPVRLARSAN